MRLGIAEYLIAHRNNTYRLYSGSAATTRQICGVAYACRLAWSEIKAAYESLYEHACGRAIAPPTFMTFDPAFTVLCRQHAWLQEHLFAVEEDIPAVGSQVGSPSGDSLVEGPPANCSVRSG